MPRAQTRPARARELPNWRIVRYADDFVVLVHGTQADAEALREEVAACWPPLGLRLSPAKTRVVHMSDGFGFLGFRIQWKRKRGTSKWHVYTFIADRPIRSLKAKIRALTNRTSQQDLRAVLIRLNQIMRGWANYFRHAVCKHTMGAWPTSSGGRVIRWLRTLHRWRWKDVRRQPHRPRRPVDAVHSGRDRTVQPRVGTGHPVPLPRQHDPQPLDPGEPRLTAATVESPLRGNTHGGFGERPGETDRGAIPAPRPRPTQPRRISPRGTA